MGGGQKTDPHPAPPLFRCAVVEPKIGTPTPLRAWGPTAKRAWVGRWRVFGLSRRTNGGDRPRGSGKFNTASAEDRATQECDPSAVLAGGGVKNPPRAGSERAWPFFFLLAGRRSADRRSSPPRLPSWKPRRLRRAVPAAGFCLPPPPKAINSPSLVFSVPQFACRAGGGAVRNCLRLGKGSG